MEKRYAYELHFLPKYPSHHGGGVNMNNQVNIVFLLTLFSRCGRNRPLSKKKYQASSALVGEINFARACLLFRPQYLIEMLSRAVRKKKQVALRTNHRRLSAKSAHEYLLTFH